MAALAGWLAVSTVAPYVHLAETVHRTCPEHGELVEVPAAGSGDHGADDHGDDDGTSGPGSTALPEDGIAATSGETGSSDDHCSLCPASAPRGTPGPLRSIGLTTFVHVVVVASTDRIVGADRRALFRVAPKTSPPAPRPA